MFSADTELIFPPRIISILSGSRGEAWNALVERVAAQADSSPDQFAFVLLMVRLNGCLTCHADAYRAMRGCTECARQAVRRFKGSDEELLQMFAQALEEVTAYLV